MLDCFVGAGIVSFWIFDIAFGCYLLGYFSYLKGEGGKADDEEERGRTWKEWEEEYLWSGVLYERRFYFQINNK